MPIPMPDGHRVSHLVQTHDKKAILLGPLPVVGPVLQRLPIVGPLTFGGGSLRETAFGTHSADPVLDTLSADPAFSSISD